MAGIGHNNNSKQHVSVNSLSDSDKKYLKGVISEINDSLTRMSAERDLQKQAIDAAFDKLGVDKKIIKRMAKTYYSASFNKEVQEHNEFEDFYTIIMNGEKT